jgi:hypothetical protein
MRVISFNLTRRRSQRRTLMISWVNTTRKTSRERRSISTCESSYSRSSCSKIGLRWSSNGSRLAIIIHPRGFKRNASWRSMMIWLRRDKGHSNLIEAEEMPFRAPLRVITAFRQSLQFKRGLLAQARLPSKTVILTRLNRLTPLTVVQRNWTPSSMRWIIITVEMHPWDWLEAQLRKLLQLILSEEPC